MMFFGHHSAFLIPIEILKSAPRNYWKIGHSMKMGMKMSILLNFRLNTGQCLILTTQEH